MTIRTTTVIDYIVQRLADEGIVFSQSNAHANIGF